MSEPVIVVGSGPAGVSAAFPLLHAGIPTVMIDAAPPDILPAPPSGDIAEFRGRARGRPAPFGGDVSEGSPKLATPIAQAALAGYADAIGLSTANFLALGSMRAGGLSNLWGAAVAVYDDAELRGFPFPRADLMPSYATVMRRIGVSGPDGADGVDAPAGPPLTAALDKVWTNAQRATASVPFELARATNAVLMDARDGRGACTSCGLCLWGCARGSIYASGFDRSLLEAFPHFAYRSGVRVRRLLPAAERPSVEVESGGIKSIMMGRRVLLACGTIATTALVMRALQIRQPLRLLTNPVGAMAFVVPSLVATPPPSRSFALAQLAYRLASDSGSTMAGSLYGADALPLTVLADRLPMSRPSALRLSRALSPALVLASCFLPGSFSANTIRIADENDNPMVVVEGGYTAECGQVFKAGARRLAKALRRLGAYPLPGSFSVAPPGADAHYVGTLPMGAQGMTGTDTSGALSGLPGMHIVDGAALSDLPARHCTLTIMANADRIARKLASEALVAT